MGRVLDTLEASMIEIAANPDKILDENFMMNIFKEYIEELPPFKEHWGRTFQKNIWLLSLVSLAQMLCTLQGFENIFSLQSGQLW